jgi:putative transposase
MPNRKGDDALADNNITHLDWLRKKLEDSDDDLLKEMLHYTIQMLMHEDANVLCGAEYRERSPERVNNRNGYRSPRRFDTRLGSIDLLIPKLRKGSYYPGWLLEPRKRSEKALVQVICEAYVEGVSTRKMDRLVQAMGIAGISKSKVSEMAKNLDEMVEKFRKRLLLNGPYRYVWLDATVVKCRECGSVDNVAIVTAIGVNDEGRREILGVEVFTIEDEASWTAFLRDLVERGLSGVRLVTSDAHPGLKKAIAKVIPGAAWNRCYTHFSRNVLTKVPKKAQGRAIALLRSVTAQRGAETSWEQYDKVADVLIEKHPQLSDLLDDAREEVLAFTSFPLEHWRKIRTNNPLENLNSQIKRRTKVVGIFPNRASIIRLVGMVLLEQHEDWMVGRRYMSVDSLRSLDDERSERHEELTEVEPECVELHTPR